MSPGSRSACAMARMTRARPSTVPAETGRPTSAPAVASVRPGDDLAIRCEHPGRCERLIRPERVLAPADELVIHVVRAHDVVELLEPQVGARPRHNGAAWRVRSTSARRRCASGSYGDAVLADCHSPPTAAAVSTA